MPDMKKSFFVACVFLVSVILFVNSVAFAAAYKITVQIDPAGGGSVTGDGEYEDGKNAVLTATPSEGYTFSGWYREDGKTLVTTDESFDYDLEVTRTYVAKFDKALTVGAIAEPAEGGSVTGGGEFVMNQSCTLTAASNEGYSFMGWFDASSPATALSTDSTYTFQVSQPVSLIARFASLYRLDVNVMPEEGGSVTGTGMFAGGSIVMMEAMPNEDYRFEGWVSPADPSHIVSTEEKYTFNLDTDTTYTAKFARSYQYIWTRVIIFAAIGAGAFIGILFLLRYLNTVRRRPDKSRKQPTSTFYRPRKKK